MISGNVPGHLIIGARTGFLTGIKTQEAQWQQLAMTMQMDGKTNDLVDLGAAPMPVRNRSGMTIQEITEKTMQVTPVDWDITVFLSHNAIEDDRIGDLKTKVLSAGQNFNKHINKLVFQQLNGGDSTTYGVAYDTKNFFSATHADKGAFYQTAQSNLNTLTLTPDNFETVYVASSLYKDDQGEPIGFVPNLLVVPPAYQRIANQLATNPTMYNTANRESNAWAGQIDYMVSPYLDSTSWYLVDTKENVKPIIFVMREKPNLQSAWFDPDKPEGGHYYFKFFARYNVFFGDWRLATQGSS